MRTFLWNRFILFNYEPELSYCDASYPEKKNIAQIELKERYVTFVKQFVSTLLVSPIDIEFIHVSM